MCSICEHEHRKEIDLLIVSGESAREISRRWKVAQETVRAHKKTCMARTDQMLIEMSTSRLAGALAVTPYESGPQLAHGEALQQTQMARLLMLSDKAEAVLDKVIASGDARNFAPILTSLRQTIESAIGKGQGGNINIQVNNDLKQSAEWKAMMKLCTAHPELHDELLSYLS